MSKSRGRGRALKTQESRRRKRKSPLPSGGAVCPLPGGYASPIIYFVFHFKIVHADYFRVLILQFYLQSNTEEGTWSYCILGDWRWKTWKRQGFINLVKLSPSTQSLVSCCCFLTTGPLFSRPLKGPVKHIIRV